MTEHLTIIPQEPQIPDQDALVLELQRLLACYQLAEIQDRKIVWSALNKYVHLLF